MVNRQINPEIPAWAVPMVLREKQTFITANPTEKNFLMDMMGDMWALAIAAVQSMGTPEAPIYSSSFLRYFGVEEWGDVRDGYMAILGSACAKPIHGPDELSLVRIYWDTGAAAFTEIPDMTEADDCANIGALAYGTSDQSKVDTDLRYWIVVCPSILAFRTVLRPFDCSLLESRRMSRSLLVAGQTMLHEMMHWPYIADKAVKGAGIQDWNLDALTGDPLDPNTDPVSGYGPYNAWRLNKVQGRGSENPDNYAFFAYESYLLQDKPGQCGGGAMDPPLIGFGDPIGP